jgi:methyl-accepting chemotaxis protein
MEEQEWKELFMKMYKKVYSDNDNFYKLWDSWELKFFDESWNKDYGRFAVTLFKQNGKISSSESIRSLDGDSELYTHVKTIAKDMLWEPYWNEFLEESEQKKFMTTLSSPIFRNKEFAGIVAADIIMVKLQQITDQITVHEGTSAYLISNGGTIVAHPDPNFVGEAASYYFQEFEEQFQLSQKIKEGIPFISRGKDFSNKKVIIVTTPIQVGEYVSPWSLTLTIPYKSILSEANRTLIVSIIAGLLGLLLLCLIILRITSSMSKSLVKTKDIMKRLSTGDIEGIDDLVINRGDEIEDIANSLNELKNGLKNTSEFANQMGKGNLESDFIPLSNKDIMGNSLLEMRQSLKHAREEEEKRKIEDEKQNWATTGLAKFGDILRSNSTNIKELSFNIMSNLVNYLELNQGALFIVEQNDDDDEPFLELKTAIAYDRDRLMQKRLAFGESLVGRCAFEMKSIYMTDLPQEYIKIKSGMGTANPTSILLAPLILNQEVYGVIELASFKDIEPFQIEFIEKLGESIASTIATVKVNEKTSTLLEQSKRQSEELAAQEEEMRQNLEELQATQEEAARREFEMSGIVNALGSTAFTVEYDLDGTILSCNEKYAEMLGMSKDNVLGQKHSDGYDINSEMGTNYAVFWADLCRGNTKKEVNKVTINNREIWVEETYTPIKEPNETTPYKILKIGFDITAQQIREIKMKEQEIEIKKEHLLIGEYKSRITELQDELNKANNSTKEIGKAKNSPVIKSPQVEPIKEAKATGDNLLDWNSDFVLGIAEMDEQHEQLVDLANLINSSFRLNKNKKEIKENLRSFIDFASYHFGNEEHYFNEFGYKNTDDHIANHQKLLKELKQFQTAYHSNKTKELDGILDFIQEWLVKHFEEFDATYKELFKSNGL